MNIDNITSINIVFFLTLLAVNFFEIFPKHSGFGFVSEFSALN